MITTNDSSLVRRLRALRNHGQDAEASSTDFIMPGFNYRMTEFQAALGISQMTKLDRVIASRRRTAANYNALLSGTSVQAPKVAEGGRPVYQSYVVLLPKYTALNRQAIIEQLRQDGVETTIGTWNMPMTSYFRSRYAYRTDEFPVANQIFAHSLCLPLHENISSQEQQYIMDHLFEYCNEKS